MVAHARKTRPPPKIPDPVDRSVRRDRSAVGAWPDGLMSYLVAERSKEIGIRVVLGSQRRNVLEDGHRASNDLGAD